MGCPAFGTLWAEAFPSSGMGSEDVSRALQFHGQTAPSGMGIGAAVVWEDTGLFAVASGRPPVMALNGSEPLAMTAVGGTSLWYRLETVERGRLHLFRFGVDGEWGPGGDVVGYTQHSYEPPNTRRGTISERRTVSSEIYPGATTEYWLYVNHGIDEERERR